ncbi:MAG: energy transducer TonB [Muribaculaceae bacterium]|nr:energy transducer TonB [Muribaculaceae bacterium]MDE5712385.1 energy transducer TonB [Muribaculaceae bacterium]
MKKMIISLLAFAGISLGAMAADTPSFPGGKEALDKFISTNLVYPQTSKSLGVEGVVTLQFIVNTDGSIGTIKVVRMIDPDLEQEAIRIVKKMPAWIPADKDGVPVESTAEVSVPFVLDSGDE